MFTLFWLDPKVVVQNVNKNDVSEFSLKKKESLKMVYMYTFSTHMTDIRIHNQGWGYLLSFWNLPLTVSTNKSSKPRSLTSEMTCRSDLNVTKTYDSDALVWPKRISSSCSSSIGICFWFKKKKNKCMAKLLQY